MATTQSAIMDALGQAHSRLTDDLRRLDLAVHQESEQGLDVLRKGLSSTYTHVCEHFRLEELGGFLNDVEDREPRFARIARGLALEHRELRQSLDSLHGEANVAARVDASLREAVRKWIAKMRLHETRENDLMQDVFESDLGAPD